MHQSFSRNSSSPDVVNFVTMLGGLEDHPHPSIRSLFDPTGNLLVARAPGRLDLMGGIADYSGSLVLQLPTREATLAAIQSTETRTLTIVSLSSDRPAGESSFSMPLADLEQNGLPIEYTDARAYFQRNSKDAWAAYVAGAIVVLMRERNVQFDRGLRLLLHSEVPEGKGVSSSAAVEVASMAAIAAAMQVEIAPRDMGILCQMVENLVVGAPCGVMDQMSSVCGEEGQLLALHCQPAELQAPVAIPDELTIWGIDSGIRHAVSGEDYGSVRVGAFMGYRILLDLAGVADADVPVSQIDDTLLSGYLANMTPSIFEQHYRKRLPEALSGADFLARYQDTTDSVTQVDPSRVYAVRQPTLHPIYENFRVRTFRRLLQGDASQNGPLLGECMYQSHASYSACGLGSDGTDALVQQVRDVGNERGLYGAKITGGGSGGTVAILGLKDAGDIVEQIADQYAADSGREPYLFTGSSPGAAASGIIHLPTLSG